MLSVILAALVNRAAATAVPATPSAATIAGVGERHPLRGPRRVSTWPGRDGYEARTIVFPTVRALSRSSKAWPAADSPSIRFTSWSISPRRYQSASSARASA